MQEKLIFLPTKLPKDYVYEFSENFEEIYITAEDGAILNALHFKAESPKGVILYFHGNAGDLSRWGSITTYFVEQHYDVLVMDYRTYGKSTGNLSEEALYNDTTLFYKYLLKQYPEDQITVYGRSLGCTFATYIASLNKPKQLILETPFYNLTDVAKHRFPFLPVKLMLKYRFPTNQYIKEVTSPITIFHGTDDSVVMYDSGKKLSETKSMSTINFITIPKGDHNNLIEFKEYRVKIEKILN